MRGNGLLNAQFLRGRKTRACIWWHTCLWITYSGKGGRYSLHPQSFLKILAAERFARLLFCYLCALICIYISNKQQNNKRTNPNTNSPTRAKPPAKTPQTTTRTHQTVSKKWSSGFRQTNVSEPYLLSMAVIHSIILLKGPVCNNFLFNFFFSISFYSQASHALLPDIPSRSRGWFAARPSNNWLPAPDAAATGRRSPLRRTKVRHRY